MLETGVEMWLQTQLDDHWVMVAVDMGVDSVKAFEDLAYQSWKRLGEGYACAYEIPLLVKGH